MRLGKRLVKVAAALAAKGRADQFHSIEVVPVGCEQAEGRGPGLHRAGPEGSLAGLLVYDPADGPAAVPEGRLAPWGTVVRCHPPNPEPG